MWVSGGRKHAGEDCRWARNMAWRLVRVAVAALLISSSAQTAPITSRTTDWAAQLGHIGSNVDGTGRVQEPMSPVFIHLSDGSIMGSRKNGTDYFLGIPFAKPPVDDFRWHSPVKNDAWQGTRDAQFFRPNCASHDKGVVSEDCLYLNVFRASPNDSSSSSNSPLPVMVWIYGGAFVGGGAENIVYADPNLALIGDVIMVTLNYRLGPFGFAANPQLRKSDVTNSTGNYGLQDQQAALRWVQANIGAFGGDPKKVTIFGESAGGGSVSDQLIMPRSNGLFRSAIIESGAPSVWTTRSLDAATKQFDCMISTYNCANVADQIACMRKIAWKDLLEHQCPDPTLTISWAPVVDGVEIPDTTENLWREGKLNAVDAVIIGNVHDEGSTFMRWIELNGTVDDYYTWVNRTYVGTVRDAILSAYSVEDYPTPYLAASAVRGDSFFTCPSRRAAGYLRKANVASYLYLFNHFPLAAGTQNEDIGVFHGSEVPFVFNYVSAFLSPAETDLSISMVKYWTSLAHTGTPNSQDTTTAVFWPLFDPQKSNYLALNLTRTVEDDFIGDAKCSFWAKASLNNCNLQQWPTVCNI